MKVGDFVYCTHTAFSMPGIVKILELDGQYDNIIQQINYPSPGGVDFNFHRFFGACDTIGEEPALARWEHRPIFDLKPFSLILFAEELQKHPLIRPSEKDNLAEFITRKLIEEFGEPPKKIVEASLEKAKILAQDKPAVLDGQTGTFIRINNK